jgi:hypothetical protein
MSDNHLRTQLIRLASTFPKGSEERRSVLGLLKNSAFEDDFESGDLKYLPKGFVDQLYDMERAAIEVRRAIDHYSEACRSIQRMDVPPQVKKLVERGESTARKHEDIWTAIQDDPHVLVSVFKRAIAEGWLPD